MERVVDGLDEKALSSRTEDPSELGEVVAPVRAAARRTRDRRRARCRRPAPPRPRRCRAHELERLLLISSACWVREHSGGSGSARAADALVLPLLLDPLGVDVDRGVVGGRVRRRAVGHRLENVAPSPARRARRRRASPRRRRDVTSVDADARNPVADRLVGERRRGRLRGERRRDRPLVVVAERITGAFITPANVAPSWNAPSEVAPSPKSVSATRSSPFSRDPTRTRRRAGPAWRSGRRSRRR